MDEVPLRNRLNMRRTSMPVQSTQQNQGEIMNNGSGAAMPTKILFVCKPSSTEVLRHLQEMIDWLINEKKFYVYLEASDYDNLENIKNDNIRRFSGSQDAIGLVVCLGGDGTLLHAASLFPANPPPMMPFRLGGLGFMTPFSADSYRENINQFIKGASQMVYRQRIRVSMIDSTAKEASATQSPSKIPQITTRKKEVPSYEVLNEVTVSRNHEARLCRLEVYVDGQFVTTFIGDSLIVSTATGSTAYSLSAGGSIVHPSLRGILLTPICPHSLSFRPVVLPMETQIEIRMAASASLPVHVQLDGSKHFLAHPGHSLKFQLSSHPVPCVCRADPSTDWFSVLRTCLHWNSRAITESNFT